ncbi:MAG: tRNA adenosine(34) deaminase TadA [Gemmatimonadota bacterium]
MSEAADRRWMARALELAREAGEREEVPVGAVLVGPDGAVAEASNRTRERGDPTAHAELLAIRHGAERLGDWRLLEHTLYVTLEPCAMCAGATVLARIPRLLFAARDPKAGMCGSLGDLVRDPRLNHRVEVREGLLAEEAGELLREFFQARRRSSP